MFFDPLTTWIVSLIADGINISGQHSRGANLTMHNIEQVNKSNTELNAEIRRRLIQKNYIPERELQDIKTMMEYYKNKYEYRYGAVVLDLDVQELMINLYKKCIEEHQKELLKYKKIYYTCKKKGKSKDDLWDISLSIDSEKSIINSYEQVLEAVEKQRNQKVKFEEKRVTENKVDKKDASSMILIKSILVIGLCICAFALVFAGCGKLLAALCMIGVAIGGYYILK